MTTEKYHLVLLFIVCDMILKVMLILTPHLACNLISPVIGLLHLT